MSHLLGENGVRCPVPAGRAVAALEVWCGPHSGELVSNGTWQAVTASARFVRLPAQIKVMDCEFRQVKPREGCQWWISVETHDPHHLLVDAPTLPMSQLRPRSRT
jgi:hypothetical protein